MALLRLATIALLALPACANTSDVIVCPLGPTETEIRVALRKSRVDCDNGVMKSCAQAGILLIQPLSAPPADRALAVRLLRKACDADVAVGCHWLSLAYDYGLGVKSDEPRADRLKQRACELGSVEDCSSVGHAKVVVAPSQSADLLEKSCARGRSQDCVQAARVLVDSFESSDAASRVQRLANLACKLDDKRACDESKRLAGIAHRIGSYEESVSACAGGDGAACHRAGRGYMHNSPLQHAERAANLLRRGCDLGNVSSCVALADQYELGLGVPKHPARAHEMRAQYCNATVAEACAALGREYATSLATKRNPRRALEYYLRACDLGGAQGCASAAELVESDGEFGWNRQRALELYERGCKLDENVCDSATELRGRLGER